MPRLIESDLRLMEGRRGGRGGNYGAIFRVGGRNRTLSGVFFVACTGGVNSGTAGFKLNLILGVTAFRFLLLIRF